MNKNKLKSVAQCFNATVLNDNKLITFICPSSCKTFQDATDYYMKNFYSPKHKTIKFTLK